MKKTRKTMIAVLLTMLLVGCASQEPPEEAQAPIPEVTAPQATEAREELPTTVPEDTTPTTATEEPQPASETTATEPEKKASTVKSEEPEKSVPKPQATEPKETTLVETKPADTKPQSTEPPATKQPVTEVPTTEPAQPPVTEPPATEPEPTEPAPTVTVPTEPPAEAIDTTALEASGRSYAFDTYGYNGTTACHPGTGAGCFPAATKVILSQEEGLRYVKEAIDNQHVNDKNAGFPAYEEIDGKIVRCPINVSVSPTGEANVYTITVYYGGTA